jgi:hypothetical protein
MPRQELGTDNFRHFFTVTSTGTLDLELEI